MTKRTVCIQYYDSPCGKLVLASVGDALCLCDWCGMPCAERNRRRLERVLNAELVEMPSAVTEMAKKELDEYFGLKRKRFDIPLRPIGTDFQKRVWEALQKIPYGETRSYKDMAQMTGNAKGARAVAGAIGANGISIIIPCHRVVGTDGSLTGFAGGIEAKRTLLDLERKRLSDETIKE